MRDLGTEAGTFYTYCLPEPDGHITIGWGRAIALGIARLTTPGIVEQVMYGNSSPATCAIGTNPYFSKAPLLRAYTKDGSVYSDYEVMGSGCTINPAYADSVVWVGFVDSVTNGQQDSILVGWGTSDEGEPNERTGTIMVYAVGR